MTSDRDFEYEIAPSLEEALARDDAAEVRQLVARGVSLNVVRRDGATPLALSMLAPSSSMFLELLRLGADVNQISRGVSAVHLAAGAEDPTWLQLAVEYGGDPNLVAGQERTPIFSAVSQIRPSNVALLVDSGAELDHQDSTGNTALMTAAYLNRYDLVLQLLEAGADPQVQNNWRRTLTDVVKDSHVDPNHELYQWRERVITWMQNHESR